MYARDVLAGLRRRWYLLVAGILATAALAGAAFVAIPATYQSGASMLLLPPPSSVTNRGNPFLYLGGLNQALDVLTTRLRSDAVQKPIAKAHPDVTLEIARDATTSGPILVISVSGPDAQESMTVVQQLVDQVPTSITELQDSLQIPTNSRISSMLLSRDNEPEKSVKNKLRAAIALSGLGIAGTVVLVGFADAQLTQRAQRRRGQLTAARLQTGAEEPGSAEEPQRPETAAGVEQPPSPTPGSRRPPSGRTPVSASRTR